MSNKLLTQTEQDALGEIANMSIGSSATALSQILNYKVDITHPTVTLQTLRELRSQLPIPHIAIEVQYTKGLSGSNLLVMRIDDAAKIAQIMMGLEPTLQEDPLDEMQISAVSEAMNQMMASSATSMSQVFNTLIDISLPESKIFSNSSDENFEDEELVIIKFKIIVADIISSELMQMIPVKTAKNQVELLMKTME